MRRRNGKSPLTLAVITLAVATLLGACSTGLTVRSDQDPSADFSQYRTYGFFDPLGVEGGYNSPIYGELFREAISNEMTSRGYTLTEEPDLLINVTLRTDDKVRMTTYTAPYMSGMFYDRPGGFYGSSVGLGVGTASRATEKTEVSVFIDLVDRRKQRVSWQGVAVTDASDKVAQRLRDAVFTAVDTVFKQYAYTAEK